MDPQIGRQIARQIEANQVALLRNESARRQKLASPRAQVLTYRDGAVYNQGSNGSLTPTRLITNRGIPEGGTVSRKGGGASDASPYFRRRQGLNAITTKSGAKRTFAISLEVEFIRAVFFGPVQSIAEADEIHLIPVNEISITNSPGGDPFKFLIPANSSQTFYSRGNRDLYPFPLIDPMSGLATNVPLTPWRGARLGYLSTLDFISQVTSLPVQTKSNFEARMATKDNPDYNDSNGGFQIPGVASTVTFSNGQVVGIPDSEFRLPDYTLEPEPSSVQNGNAVIALRIKQSDVFEVGL